MQTLHFQRIYSNRILEGKTQIIRTLDIYLNLTKQFVFNGYIQNVFRTKVLRHLIFKTE